MDAVRFKEIVLPLNKRIYPYAVQLLKDQGEAEDVVQDVWTRFWEMGEKLAGIRNLEAYAFRMTRNLCLDKLKRKRPEYFDDREEQDHRFQEADYEPDPGHRLETRDSMEKVMKILGRMPEQQQTLLHMREIEGLNYEEIASITGLEVNAIRVSLSRTRKKIREMMEKIYQL